MKTIIIVLASILIALPMKSETIEPTTIQNGDPTIYVGNNQNTTETSSKPQRAPRKSTIGNSLYTTTGLIFVEFTADIENVSVSIYKENTEVITDYACNIYNGSIIPYDISLYGKGGYVVYITSTDKTLAYENVIFK